MLGVWLLIELIGFAALVIVSVLFERRYRGRKNALRGNWQATGERFKDPVSGELTEVYYDPKSGERDYRPIR